MNCFCPRCGGIFQFRFSGTLSLKKKKTCPYCGAMFIVKRSMLRKGLGESP